MKKHNELGYIFRLALKQIILDYLRSDQVRLNYVNGIKTAEIFRNCGLDWGEKKSATSTHQQYWLVALLGKLEEEKYIVRDSESKNWKIKNI